MTLKPCLTENSFSRASSGGTSPQSPDRWRSSSAGKRSSPALLSRAKAPGVATRRPRGKRAAMSAAHPFEAGPNRVDEAVLRVAMQAPHRLVLAPGVLQAPERPATLGGTPGGLV